MAGSVLSKFRQPHRHAPVNAGLRVPRVLIIADHASSCRGGEAILPLHYFRGLHARGVPVWLITHSRTRDELQSEQTGGRIRFIPDTAPHRLLARIGRALPRRLRQATVGLLSRLLTQVQARNEAARLIREECIDIVHQPTPVSPREPSALFGLGVPVVIGPMNGGMDYPPAFRSIENPVTRFFITWARAVSRLSHRLLPGKRKADALLVANARTRSALPTGVSGRVIEVPENGVDPALWKPRVGRLKPGGPGYFVFVGRLVDWKAVDILLEALARTRTRRPTRLKIIGDGPMRKSWSTLARSLGLQDQVTFSGWLPQPEVAKHLASAEALLLPSLYECGGAVVLEAMCCAVPVVAIAWGGPVEYLNEDCGILVEPDSREALVNGFASAMCRLAESPELRASMGRAARERARTYHWDYKIDRMLEIYRETLSRRATRMDVA